MKDFILFTGLLLLAGCSSTKITSTRYAGYRMHEQIVITPLAAFSETDNDWLMQRANAELAEELIFLKPVPYQDALYQVKQLGITLPEFNRYDTATFKTILNKLNIHYVLTGEVIGVKSEYHDRSSPNYLKPEAVLSFQLLDMRNKTIVWRATTRTTVNPISVGEETKINVRDEDNAISVAYKKTIKRLTKNFELIPNRKL
jgi:hypothetical protein